MSVRKAALAALCLLATPARADPISGYVYKDGTVAFPSSLYTVQHTRRGHYTIQFTTPMEPSASCVVTPITGRRLGGFFLKYVLTFKETDTECSFVFGKSDSKPTNIDSDFSFIAVPISN